jgi:BNR repeat-like domain
VLVTRIQTPSRRRGLVAAVLAIATLVILIAPASASAALTRISQDPYTDPGSQHATEVEPDTLSFGSTIVSAVQVGRFFSGGSSNIGISTSTNSGSSWTARFLPGTTPVATPAGPWARTSDPAVAYDAKHNVWMVSYLGLFPGGNGAEVDVLVSRSTDGGLTWGNPVVVNADGHFNDKNWTTCDDTPTSPFYGNCYTEFDDNTLGDLVQMSTSSDGGLTWGAGRGTANRTHGIGGQPLVQPSGRVIVPIVGFTRTHFMLLSFTSDTGGASWSASNGVGAIQFRPAAGGLRDSIPLPSAEMDAAGKVYAVWQDCRFEQHCSASDLLLSTTVDGATWSEATRIPLDPRGSGVDHFIPGLAVDRTTSGAHAHLVLAYYAYRNAACTTATCQLDISSSTSSDGGATWTAGSRLAGPMSLTWLPNTSQGFMVGDYVSTSFSGGAAFPAFALAHAPTGGVFDEATYTVAGGLQPTASAPRTAEQTGGGATANINPGVPTDQ